ncbi:hypothetical protein DYD21_16960 [Rhodohalobacter sp. SW132]|uniref:hypothetical protein n=1 Tax=Rhodohalobacter sp. SW132 TaxID=2293433 RepID=UPI000E2742BD|nr:hypothetical protein [Rhodohalobacter sp. SW132]REL24848.1 hypothetical protein DYD21_16960 [Rhodohalobacter sp. SW132]
MYPFTFDIKSLDLWLSYELSGSALFMMSFFYIASLYLLGALILLFLPILVGTLIHEKRYGWLIFFLLFVGLPALFIYFIFDSGSWFHVLRFVPIALFLFYCLLLKLTLPGWDNPAPEPAPKLQL